jgi:hypothetical protein
LEAQTRYPASVVATLAELWAGPHLKQEHATYFWQRMQDSGALISAAAGRPFYAEFDAFLAMARSVPELIQACFGMQEMPPKYVRDWFDRLDPGEKQRRTRFTTQFEPMYRAFQNLPLSNRRTVILQRAGGAGVQVLIVDRFGVSPATQAVSGEPSWTDLSIDGHPLYDEVVAYLEQVSNLIAAAHKIAAEVHGAQSLTAPI